MRGNKPQGFTLFEILLTITIFVILTTLIINVFILTLRSQRETSARQSVLSEIRFVMDDIARHVRNSRVVYTNFYTVDGDDGISGAENELHLVNAEGTAYSYLLQNGTIAREEGGVVTPLTSSSKMEIKSFDIYIDPPTDPFKEERCNDNRDLYANNGCISNSIVCTVNDESGYTGYCECDSNDDCASQFCSADGVCLPQDIQPRATIVIGLEYQAARAIERKTIYVQTTVVSRIYER